MSLCWVKKQQPLGFTNTPVPGNTCTASPNTLWHLLHEHLLPTVRSSLPSPTAAGSSRQLVSPPSPASSVPSVSLRSMAWDSEEHLAQKRWEQSFCGQCSSVKGHFSDFLQCFSPFSWRQSKFSQIMRIAGIAKDIIGVMVYVKIFT